MHLVHTYWNITENFYPNASQLPRNTTIKPESNHSEYAVVALLFQVDYEIDEDAFDTFLPHPDESNTTNLRKAFECVANRFFYYYRGSLTTPDCDEGV